MSAAGLILRAGNFSMNVDQFINVFYLKKEVWGFESYNLGLLASRGIILSGH